MGINGNIHLFCFNILLILYLWSDFLCLYLWYIAQLVHRMTEGLSSNKYKPVDYNRLKALTSEKKFASIKTSMKVKKIEEISKANKESSILKQHRLIWQKEFLHLQHLRRKVVWPPTFNTCLDFFFYYNTCMIQKDKQFQMSIF